MIKSGIVRKRFHFFVWELLTNEKELRIIMSTTTCFLFCGKSHQFYIFRSMDIIKVGLYLLSRLQNPSRQIVDRLSQTYEKGIFYGAVLARGGIFFIELNMELARSR